MPLSPARINVLSLFCETLLYGIYAELVAAVLYICCTARNISRPQAGLYTLTFIMFLLASGHEAILLAEQLGGKITMRQTQAAVAIAQIMIAFADAILIWRVWVVWSKRHLVIVIPVMSTTTGLVIGLLSAATITSHDSLKELLPLPTLALGLANTIVCTALIAGRLVYLECKLSSALGITVYSTRSYRKIVLLVVESGALLVSLNTIAMVLMETNNPALHIVLNLGMPLCGIVPTIIIVLAHFDLILGNHYSQRCTSSTVLSEFEAQVGSEPKPVGRVTTSAPAFNDVIHIKVRSDSAYDRSTDGIV